MLQRTLAGILFAIAAHAQSAFDNITVDPGGPLLHSPPVLLSSGPAGTVTVDATLNALGEVTAARVISGPDELRKPVLANVLQWHYASQPAPPPSVRITVTFKLPSIGFGGGAAPQPESRPTITFAGAPGAGPASPLAATAPASPLTIGALNFDGLTPELTALIEQTLGVKTGDTVDSTALIAKVAAVDPHLRVRFETTGARGTTALSFALQPQEQFTLHPQAAKLTPVPLGGTAANAQVAFRVPPVYPPIARHTNVGGTVVLDIFIATDGTVKDLSVLSGPAMFRQAALDAVRQWIFRPALLNGAPTETLTQTEVNFTLQ
jgi:TonB family protein